MRNHRSAWIVDYRLEILSQRLYLALRNFPDKRASPSIRVSPKLSHTEYA